MTKKTDFVVGNFELQWESKVISSSQECVSNFRDLFPLLVTDFAVSFYINTAASKMLILLIDCLVPTWKINPYTQ